MFRLVERRRYFFLFSAILTTVGLLVMIYSTATTGSPVQLGIDFTGGTLYQLQFTESVNEQSIRDVYEAEGFLEIIVQELNPLQTESLLDGGEDYPLGSRWSVRTEEAGVDRITSTFNRLRAEVAPLVDEATLTNEVSGSVGDEVTRAAVAATLVATFVILGFIWFAFRGVPKAYRYGACAIAAMLHDVFVVMMIMSILGMLFDWQADSLFLTALLTVLGFSVQDSIVVFDRIRENIPRRRGESYELVVNRSILEMLHRSLATGLNVMFVMTALVFFGGETIRQFTVVMLAGLISGTYSSIFIAVPLLVAWEKGEIPFLNREAKRAKQSAVTT